MRLSEQSARINELLLDSLPHPAMLIGVDRVVLAANRFARRMGVKVGGYCWRDFGQSEFIPEEHKRYINEHDGNIPPGGTKCSCCRSDEAMAEDRALCEPEVRMHGRFWDTWWVPVDDERYLHYAVDVTERKTVEKELILAKDELEGRVEERTAELLRLNEQLAREAEERKQAEEALRRSEQRFRLMFEKNLAVQLLIDPEDGAIVDANPAACSFYGYGMEDLLKMRITDINTLSAETVAEEMRKALEENRNHFFFKHRLSTGEVRDVEVHSSPIEFGGQLLLYSTVYDITERNRAEALLQLERDKFMGIALTTENAVFIINADHEIEYLNPVAEKEFGPVGSKKCYEYFQNGNEVCSWCTDKGPCPDHCIRSVWTSPATGKTYDLFGAPIRNADGTVSRLRIFHDVTEHKRVEERLRLDEMRFRALLQLSQMTEASVEETVAFAIDQQVRLTKSKLGLLGFPDMGGRIFTVYAWPREVLGQSAGAGVHVRLPLEGSGLWIEAMEKREPLLVNDCSARWMDGSGLPKGYPPLTRFMSVPVLDGDRVVAVAVVANKDEEYNDSDMLQLSLIMDGVWKLLQRKKADEVMKETEKQLRFLSSKLLTVREEEKERIAQDLHDKIGQILAAVKFGIENTLKTVGSGKVELLSQSLENLIPLVQNAIEEVRGMYMKLVPTVLKDFGAVAAIHWFCREFSRARPQLGVHEQVDIQENELPEALKVVIFRIIQEALNNIGKHSKATDVRVSLTKRGDEIHLVVADNGYGFDVESTLSSENPERGLGIASMKELTELSGGMFSIDSVYGEGTTIWASWSAAS